MTKRREVETRYMPKPIPDFRWDWEASFKDGDDEGTITGYGLTESDAIADLLVNNEFVRGETPRDVWGRSS